GFPVPVLEFVAIGVEADEIVPGWHGKGVGAVARCSVADPEDTARLVAIGEKRRPRESRTGGGPDVSTDNDPARQHRVDASDRTRHVDRIRGGKARFVVPPLFNERKPITRE